MDNDDKSLKNELIYFKEEVLKDLRFELSKFSTKIDNQRDSFSQSVSSLEMKINAIYDKYIILSTSFSEDKALKDKINNLIQFQQKTKDTLSFHESKFNYQSKMIVDSINKIDHFINDSILYNDVIGPTPNCKFQNFHNFIDYVISNITQLNNFKEKTASNDYKLFKSKIESSIESLKTQIISNSKGNNNYAKKLVEKEEEKFKEIFKLYDEKIIGLRMENSKYIANMKINFENMQREWEKLLLIRNEIYDKINKEREEENKINKYLGEKIEEYHMKYLGQNEYLNKSIGEIYNKIKKIKIQINEINDKNSNITLKIKKEEKKEKNKEEEDKEEIKEFDEEKNDDKSIEKKTGKKSFSKQYIEGKINNDQTAHLKKHKNTKSSEDKNIIIPKITNIEDTSNKKKQMSYYELLNNVFNNPRIRSIYNTNNKDVQNFIDKIIIGSVINSQINKSEYLNEIILKKLKNNNLENESFLSQHKKKEKYSDFFETKFKYNDNLKLDDNSRLINKENVNSSNNDNLYNKIYDSIKENIINNNVNENNSYKNSLNKKNIEINQFNKRLSKNLFTRKSISQSQVSILNKDISQKRIKLSPSLNNRKMTLIKKVKTNAELNKDISLEYEKNNTSNNNNIIESISKKFKENIMQKNNKEDNKKVINIINYTNKSQSQRFNQNKNNSQNNSSVPNLFKNNFENKKFNRNILIKQDIKTNFDIKNLTNKLPKTNLSLHDITFNSRYDKNKKDIISAKQIANSLRNLESQEN